MRMLKVLWGAWGVAVALLLSSALLAGAPGASAAPGSHGSHRASRAKHAKNQEVIKRRELVFRLALLALGAETLLWALALALT
jgi:hypothetical protein